MRNTIKTADGEVGAVERGGLVWLVVRDRHGDSFPRLTPDQAREFAAQLLGAARGAEQNPHRVYEVMPPTCFVPDGVAVVMEG
jgi:hypothetical protein